MKRLILKLDTSIEQLSGCSSHVLDNSLGELLIADVIKREPPG